MTNESIKVEILRNPTNKDWVRCKELALNTAGKKYVGKEVTDKINGKDRFLKLSIHLSEL